MTNKTFEDYLAAVKAFRDENQYSYTDKDLEKYQDYIHDCFKTNLSVYKCLEFMYFEVLKDNI